MITKNLVHRLCNWAKVGGSRDLSHRLETTSRTQEAKTARAGNVFVTWEGGSVDAAANLPLTLAEHGRRLKTTLAANAA